MKKTSQAIMATLLLAGVAFSAHAKDASHSVKTIDLSKNAAKYTATFTSAAASATFTDQFNFHVSNTSLLVADVTSTALSATTGLDLTGFAVYTSSGTLVYSGTKKSSGIVDNWKLNASNQILTAGDYYLQVIGKVNSAASLSGNIALKVTAVPEPETYAMMLAGLGLVGVVARRRKKSV
ncbi:MULTISPECIES: FxDxF family PEP-CTERM protein [unclassified Duganella]|uniref:FxDxF family PEP-CTERM protein n=1 Tax=unclassified Duganella TaxID=2636909 RepID=UPI00089132E9|nr:MULTISPECIES: FxDxF family PEP-CTERM protein [unclassified Duganella]SDH36455.1 PEP-CTERM protein-sorting domain-containing protein [Duganella sp. OV458]SDK52809.1 PEP-CTERM protein-sorting domain-containing protein [Duganella sp. OV510]